MRILALVEDLSIHSVSYNLANYCIDLFEKTQVDMVDLKDFDSENVNENITNKIEELASKIERVDLILISVDAGSLTFDSICNRLSNNKPFGDKPIFSLIVSADKSIGGVVLNSIQSRMDKRGIVLLETFILPSNDYNFNKAEISTVKNKLELIQKINNVKYNYFKAHYKDNSFTCGIDPTKDDCGDAREY
jgi:hypothetical protein